MLFSQRPKSYIVFLLDPCRGYAGLTASVMAFIVEFWTFIILTAASFRNKDTHILKQHEMQCWNPRVEHSQVIHWMTFTRPFYHASGSVSVGWWSLPAAPFPGEFPGKTKMPRRLHVCDHPAIHGWLIGCKISQGETTLWCNQYSWAPWEISLSLHFR